MHHDAMEILHIVVSGAARVIIPGVLRERRAVRQRIARDRASARLEYTALPLFNGLSER